jgi:O-antigen/teichoic acid export membrane protein
MNRKNSSNVVNAVIGMAALYAGKTSGILVAFLFLPFYSKVLGPDQFGLVAVLLSLQALLIMLDLGMATLVGREISAGCAPQEGQRLIRRAELTIAMFYALLLIGLLTLKAAGLFPTLTLSEACTCVAICLLLVVQNLHYTSQLATGSYRVSTLMQVVGVLARAVVTWYVLKSIEATFAAFLAAQLAVAALHLAATRLITEKVLFGNQKHEKKTLNQVLGECIELASRGRSLVLAGIAGAAALQLDKPIISLFMAPRDVTPYFLAMTLSATPVGILAAPVVQFFQPKLTAAIARQNKKEIEANLRRFVIAILAAVCIPALLMIIFINEIVDVWLKGAAWAGDVASYSRILLVGFAVAGVGYVPYAITIAKQDYEYQAKLSLFLTIVLLTGVTLASMSLSIKFVCYAYVVYFLASTAGLVCRLKQKGLKHG